MWWCHSGKAALESHPFVSDSWLHGLQHALSYRLEAGILFLTPHSLGALPGETSQEWCWASVGMVTKQKELPPKLLFYVVKGQPTIHFNLTWMSLGSASVESSLETSQRNNYRVCICPTLRAAAKGDLLYKTRSM